MALTKDGLVHFEINPAANACTVNKLVFASIAK